MPYTIYEKAGSDAAVAAALAALPPGGDSLPANAAGVLTNDGSGVLSWEAAPASSLDTEAVQDIVGAMVTGAGGTYDAAAGTITLPGTVKRFDLTDNLTVDPTDWPTDQVVTLVITQPAGGSYSVTHGGNALPLDAGTSETRWVFAGGAWYCTSILTLTGGGGTTPAEPTKTTVTATAPTWTDDATNGGGSWSTATTTGVAYSPASGTATPGQSVTVTAAVTDSTKYTLSGTSSWAHTFPVKPAPVVVVPSGAYGDAVLADSPVLYLPLDDPAGTTSPRVLGTYAAYSTFSLGGSGGTFGAAGIGDGATSLSLPGGAPSMLLLNQAKVTKDGSNGAFWGADRFCAQLLAHPVSSTAPASGSAPFLGGNGVSIGRRTSGAFEAVFSGVTILSPASYPLDERHLLTLRWDGSTVSLFVDGVSVASAALTTAQNLDWRTVVGNANVVGTDYAPVSRFAGVAAWGGVGAAIPTPARILAHAQAAGLA